MSTLRVGIVGAGGSLGNRRAQFFTQNPDSEVVLCSSRKTEKARILAGKLGCRASESWRDLVQDDEVDAVCVSNANNLHPKITRAALANGKHVLVEYPLCQELDEAKDLLALAKSRRVILHQGFCVRGEPLYRAVRQNLEWLGPIASAHVTYFGGGHWDVRPENLGNPFLVLHTRFVDYFRGWFGEVKSIAAVVNVAEERDGLACSGAILIQHERCPAALIEFGMGFPCKPKFTMHILGGGGLIDVNDRVTLTSRGRTRELAQGKNTALKVDTDSFVAQVVNHAPPLRTWPDVMRTMKVSLDCERSSRTGQRMCYCR